jgi:hypothetical protein
MSARQFLGDRQVRLASIVLFAFSLLITLRDPTMPQSGLDPSWQLAAEFAAKHRLVFGQDFIFTYGPYHYLATHLFDPKTFPLVLAYGAFSAIAVFWVALRNRSLLAVAGLAITMVALQTQNDALSTLTLFGVFLICLREKTAWGVLFAALAAPLVLAKLSWGLVILPLTLLADVHQLLRRRPPLFTAALLAGCLAAYLAAGQPIAALGDFIANTLEIILGYGRAMQVSGWRLELATTAVLIAAAVVVIARLVLRTWRADRERDFAPVTALLGFVWVLFVAFKMGFVRQDTHTLIFHQAAPGLLAMVYGCVRRPEETTPRTRAEVVLLFVALLASLFFWRSALIRSAPGAPPKPVAEIAAALGDVMPRLEQGLGWVTGQRWKAAVTARLADDEQLTRPFPPTVQGSVDALPWEVAQIVESRLDYTPRPVVQSYSSYTPRLQALDRAFFAGPKAPDTLFLQLLDIDERLPSLAVGPSLPVIGQRYDAVDGDALGLVLRRRATPRPMSVHAGGPQPVALDQWSPVPGASGHLVMAHIKVERSLAGRLLGLVYRDPLMRIDLRTRSGRETPFRFIPDMAQLGFAISPLPASWEQGAPMLLDPSWSANADPVTAVRLSTHKSNWAFKRITVAYDDVVFPPGFAGQLQGLAFLGAQLVQSDAKHAAAFTGSEIFAHADTTLRATLASPVHLKGVAGLHPQPPGSPPGDGVRFQIFQTEGGVRKAILDAVVTPGLPPVPFEIQAPAGASLEFDTSMRQNSNYDWSYWGQLGVVP